MPLAHVPVPVICVEGVLVGAPHWAVKLALIPVPVTVRVVVPLAPGTVMVVD